MNREREYAKLLLAAETAVGIISVTAFCALFFTAVLCLTDVVRQSVLIALATILLLGGVFFALRLERLAGYYACKRCGHRYIPDWKPFLFAMHVGRKRYLRCPNCGEISWQDKVIDAK
ncbi:MAG: hypothetical protein IJT07_02205 [Oscillospiraceae bacterium]|nr:hypothetical protein [Oscillospiraceae bacterium]